MTDIPDAIWWVLATVGPIPLVWLYRRWQYHRAVRYALEAREYRKRKFAGSIRDPGTVKTRKLDRPQ